MIGIVLATTLAPSFAVEITADPVLFPVRSGIYLEPGPYYGSPYTPAPDEAIVRSYSDGSGSLQAIQVLRRQGKDFVKVYVFGSTTFRCRLIALNPPATNLGTTYRIRFRMTLTERAFTTAQLVAFGQSGFEVSSLAKAKKASSSAKVNSTGQNSPPESYIQEKSRLVKLNYSFMNPATPPFELTSVSASVTGKILLPQGSALSQSSATITAGVVPDSLKWDTGPRTPILN